MWPVYQLSRCLPMACDTTGGRVIPGLEFCERLFPFRGVVSGAGGLSFDGSRTSERILFYFFHNVLRRYRRSPLFRYMRSVLRPGDVFLDVGAHLGVYSWLARTLGAHAWLFEPEPGHAAFLVRNAARLGRVFAVALGGVNGRRTLHVGDERHLGSSSLVMSARGWSASGYSHRAQVECRRLDDLVAPERVPGAIRLVKIDVEGAEEEVVAGMRGLLDRAGFDIWCEVRGERSDRNPGSCWRVCAALTAWGYRAIVYDGAAPRPFRDTDAKQVFDLLFVREPAAGEGRRSLRAPEDGP